jgi:hypothetical protein
MRRVGNIFRKILLKSPILDKIMQPFYTDPTTRPIEVKQNGRSSPSYPVHRVWICHLCHPEQGVAYDYTKTTKFPEEIPKTSSWPVRGAQNLRTQWGRKQTEKERMCLTNIFSFILSTLSSFVKFARLFIYKFPTLVHKIRIQKAIKYHQLQGRRNVF